MVRYKFDELYEKAILDYLAYDINTFCAIPHKIKHLSELFVKLYDCKRITILNYK